MKKILTPILVLMSLAPSAVYAANRCQSVFEILPGIESLRVGKGPLKTDFGDPNKPVVIPTSPISSKTYQAKAKWELVSLFQTIEHYYGPLEIKPVTIGLNWEAQKKSALKQVNSIGTSNDQYFVIADLLYNFNDAHVSVTLPSTLKYRLPLQISNAEDKLIVNFIADRFPKNVRQPEIGDELVGINGLTPDEFQKKSSVFNALGNSLTAKSYFSRMLSGMSEESGIPLSRWNLSEARLKFKPANHKKPIYEISIPYERSGVGLIGKDVAGEVTPVPVLSGTRKGEQNKVLQMARTAPGTHRIYTTIKNLFRADAENVRKNLGLDKDSKLVSGQGMRLTMGEQLPNFKLPSDFKRIQIPDFKTSLGFDLRQKMNDDFFFAGTFQRNGKKVGFLRIPSYEPTNEDTVLHSIRYFISKLRAESDYLVIDQTANPGGLVIMSDFVIKSLVGEIDLSKHLRFSVKPSQGFLREFAELKEEVLRNEDGLFTPEEVQDFAAKFDHELRKVQKAFDQGLAHSEPLSMTSVSEYIEISMDRMALKNGPLTQGIIDNVLKVDVLQPVVYEKPVYFMIDEFDFSGGDATPASLQDYGRVKLVGTRTAGAGGTVENFEHRMQSELKYRLTTSLMVRKDGRLVENYGVRPDIEVPLLTKDLRDGMKSFFERVLSSIDKDLRSTESK